MELIVGTADQLNPGNIRYRVNVSVGGAGDLLEAEAYTDADFWQKIDVYSTYLYENQPRCYILQMEADAKDWSSGQEAYLGLKFGDGISGLTATVYEGHYETKAAIEASSATEITSQIMNQNSLAMAGGYKADYSYNRNTEVTFFTKFR